MKCPIYFLFLLVLNATVAISAGEETKPADAAAQTEVPDALKPIDVMGAVISNDGDEPAKQLYLIPDEVVGVSKVTGKQDLLKTKISKDYKDIRNLYGDIVKAQDEVQKWKDAREKATEREQDRYDSRIKRLKDDSKAEERKDEEKRHNEKMDQIADFHDRKDKAADEAFKAARAKLDKALAALWEDCKSGANSAIAVSSAADAKYAIRLPHAGKYYICSPQTDFFCPIEFKAGENKLLLLRPGEKPQKAGKGKGAEDKNKGSKDSKDKDTK